VESMLNDVEVYRVDYRTSYKDSEVTASGIVILPVTADPVGMVSFQHGTIAAHSQAPTALPLSSTELILYSALASPGFITVIPDFLGFGSSAELLHPYYVEENTASAIVDNILAAKNLANQKSISFNEKLFLAGYSQGGYATMATHKRIEEDPLPGFNLVASYPAAGGYDVKGMQEKFFTSDTYDDPFYIAFVAMAYQEFYGWDTAITDFFNEPYASTIPTLFNGSKTGGQINSVLTSSVSDLIKSDLLNNIDSDPKYEYLVDAFNENSLLDWAPTRPLHMYHGTDDVTVFYENSIDTYNQLIENGAATSVITFTPLPGATHSSGVIPYIQDVIPKIIAQR
jgi:pimeloyl-ACP methyl ester carboxylesterase